MCRASSAFLVRSALAAAVFLVFSPQTHALQPGGIGSVVTFPISPGTADQARAAVLDPDGSFVLAGAGNAQSYSVMARLTAEATLDPAFGGGFYKFDFNDHLGDELHAVARMSDGRYVACGQINGSTGIDFLVARFQSNGSLDTTFNFSGFVETTFLTTGSGAVLTDVCNGVAVQSDGKIVAVGFTDEDVADHVAVIRYNTDGTLDGTFGSGGKLDINASVSATSNSSAQAVLMQPDGKILLAGNAAGTQNSDLLVIRLDANGTLDDGFGDHGISRHSIGGNDVANAMALQPDGRIVVAGKSDSDFAVARFTAAGALDPTFGTGGFTITTIGPSFDVANGVALMPWGRILAVGSARISTSAQGVVIAAAAFNADGTLDKYFGTGGKVMHQVSGLNPPDETLYGVIADIPNARAWGVGYATPTNNADFLAVEFGLPDTIFRDGFEVP